MTFQPILPYRGSDGWGYLKETLDSQKDKYAQSVPASVEADRTAFRNKIAGMTTVESFLQSGRLVQVAKEAFGLGKLVPTESYLNKVLTTSTYEPGAEAKFDDARWFEFAKAFGYGDGKPKVTDAGFADDILARHRLAGFEEAVGASSPEMRRALVFERSITSIATASFDEQTGWAQVVADDNARQVFRDAFGLGPGFDASSASSQATQLRKAAEAVTGSRKVDAFTDEKLRDAVLDDFFKARSGNVLSGLGFTRPQVGQGGTAGWTVLRGSLETQQAGFARANARDPALQHFARSIAGIESAEDLVQDERLVEVALTAFGLGDRKPTTDFVQAVLESDPDDPASVASRQGDPRWSEMARVFGFGSGTGARVAEFGFIDDIESRWRINAFEEAVGAQDNDMRLGLIVDRTLNALAGAGLGTDEGWRRALDNPSVALVMGRAFDLGDDFTTLPQSRQIEMVKTEARALTGRDGVDGFSSEFSRDLLVRRFLRNPPGADSPRGGSQPILPLGGIQGWEFLQRTLPEQRERFVASVSVQREITYFRENIANVETAADLVADRRLLAVALEAYGMSEELGKPAMIERALEQGTEDPRAMAMRLVDSRYRTLVGAFGFGDGQGAQTGVDGFAEEVIARFKVRAFETAVGQQDDSMRLALNFDRSMAELSTRGLANDSAWFRVLGDIPLRTVLEGALNLPREFSQIDVDQQLTAMKARLSSNFGNDRILSFSDPARRNEMIRSYLVREQINQGLGATGSANTALTLLQGIASPGLNLLR